MTIRNYITENIVLPLSDWFLRYKINEYLKFSFKSQYWTRDVIINYQNEKLRQLISHSYANVPFYKELFQNLSLKPEDIQTKEDLVKIPIITKEILKKNKRKHIATNIDRNNLVFSCSSGSTGEPFQYYATRNSESFFKATAIRSWYWMGYRLGDKYVKVSMNPRNSIIKNIQDYINNSVYISSNQLIPSEYYQINKKIQKSNPKFIRCYPVPLQYLSKQFKINNQPFQNTNLIAINTTGSTLHD